jgi:hypothetical protein
MSMMTFTRVLVATVALPCVSLLPGTRAAEEEVWMLADVHLDRTYLKGSDPSTNCQNGKGGESRGLFPINWRRCVRCVVFRTLVWPWCGLLAHS